MTLAVCIANGPSLTSEDVEYCRGRAKIYAVKESVTLCPWADVLYAADTDWWERHQGYADFKGERWTVSAEAGLKWGINVIDYDSALKWSDTPGLLATGGNSGFQALNKAVLDGASKVLLLGFDMGHEPGKPKHWWTGKIKRETRASHYHEWIPKFNAAAPLIQVPVVNVSRETRLECFPRLGLRDVL
jgi:hypothetical protein